MVVGNLGSGVALELALGAESGVGLDLGEVDFPVQGKDLGDLGQGAPEQFQDLNCQSMQMHLMMQALQMLQER